MQAFCATYKTNDGETTKTIGANSFTHAAKKAEEWADAQPEHTLAKLELDEETIL